jgi:hypothetical protein
MKLRAIFLSFCGLLFAATFFGQAPATQPAAPAKPAATPRPARIPGTGTVTGTVADDTGGVIPNATVTLTDGNGQTRSVKTQGDGSYTFDNVQPGTYTVSADFAGLTQTGAVLAQVEASKAAAGNIVMKVQMQKQEVTVQAETTTAVSVDPSQNVGALVLKKEDLDALPDDPDDLQQDLQALAGPSAGPSGGQIYIDGFTGGRLPPKDSIREIRINQNPFSAEYDRVGYGRIEIFTKPGSDKLHGQGLYTTSDGIWDARNPFLPAGAPFRTQIASGNVSGPLSKKASFFFDVERRWINDNGIINAEVLAPTYPFGTSSLQEFYPTPQRRTTMSPRIDYQLTPNNTLSVRYSYLENLQSLAGIGQFDLPNNGYKSVERQQSAVVTETAVLGPKVVNETRFMFVNDRTNSDQLSDLPPLSVSTAFLTGSANVGDSYLINNTYEVQNYTSISAGAHSLKFGIRLRGGQLFDRSQNGFLPAYNYAGDEDAPVLDANLQPTGAVAPLTPIQQYQELLLLQNAGASISTIVADGAGPSQVILKAGQPYVQVNQWDWGPYIQDDWRVKPNLTISLGARYEGQTNIHDKNDWAPRIGYAWSPGSAGASGRPKTVFRGGFGIFYDRFQDTNVLNTLLYNGKLQTTYTLQDAAFLPPTSLYPNPILPSPGDLIASNATTIYQIDGNLHAPYVIQTAVGIERQLAKNTTLAVNYRNSRGVHELRTVDINAPNPNAGGATLYGPPSLQLFNYESTGFFRQNQLITNFNSRVGSWLTLFSFYMFAHAESNTDGLGTIPLNQWNFSGEMGRSSLDIHHNLFVGGTISSDFPANHVKWLKGLRLAPFITAHSGAPFNITIGTINPVTGLLSARPGLATAPGPGIISTPYGLLDTNPEVGETIIPRNDGNGPAQVSFNLRLSRTWGFGTTKFAGAAGGSRASQGGGPGGGGPRGGGGGGGPRGMGGIFGDSTTEHRYNLTLSVNARNAFNHVNLGTPIGTLLSPRFDESIGIAGGFGAEQQSSENRRIDLQLRFQF